MKRALVVLAVVVSFALPALADGWSKKADAFRERALAERKKLGLDRDAKALAAKYPTPEVTFGEGGAKAVVVLCPGGEAKSITVSGKLQAGSLVGIRSEDVEIVKEAMTPKGWQASVRAKKDAIPGAVSIDVIAPVSTAMGGTNGLYIGCDHTWNFEVAGDTLVVKTHFERDTEVKTSGEWKRGGKTLGTVQLRVSVGTNTLSVNADATPEEGMKQVDALQEMMQSPEMKSIDTRNQAAMVKLQACSKLPPDKMAPCFAAPQKEMEQLAKERDALMAKAEMKSGPAFGCRRLDVDAKGGKLEGEAQGCAGKRSQDRLPVTGRYTAF